MTPPTTAYETKRLLSKLRQELQWWEARFFSLKTYRPMAVAQRGEAARKIRALKRRIRTHERRLRLFD